MIHFPQISIRCYLSFSGAAEHIDPVPNGLARSVTNSDVDFSGFVFVSMWR